MEKKKRWKVKCIDNTHLGVNMHSAYILLSVESCLQINGDIIIFIIDPYKVEKTGSIKI